MLSREIIIGYKIKLATLRENMLQEIQARLEKLSVNGNQIQTILQHPQIDELEEQFKISHNPLATINAISNNFVKRNYHLRP